jgi:competence protein ComEA
MNKQLQWIQKSKIAIPAVIFCMFIAMTTSGCKKEQPEWEMILGEEPTISQGTSTTGTTADEEQNETSAEPPICVYVCGAVLNPGVVQLPPGSRANDAVAMAGGFTYEADDSYVNLAAYVTDGEKIYIPTKEEAGQLQAAAEAEARGLVNINTADSQTLCTLPGIGESRARDIIAYRQEQGAFTVPEDIMLVPGIKEAAFAKIKEFIVVK